MINRRGFLYGLLAIIGLRPKRIDNPDEAIPIRRQAAGPRFHLFYRGSTLIAKDVDSGQELIVHQTRRYLSKPIEEWQAV